MVPWSFTPVYILSPVLNAWNFQVAVLYSQIHEGIQLFLFYFFLSVTIDVQKINVHCQHPVVYCVAPHLLRCGVGVSTALSIRVRLCCMLLRLQYDGEAVMMMFTCLCVTGSHAMAV